MLTESHMYREIHEQPEVLARFLQRERPAIGRLAEAIQNRNIGHVVIAARGTSDNAGRYAKYALGALNGLPVTLATPSLFTIYQRPPRFGNALVLGISQSGRSPDIVAVLAEARRQGALTAAITNNTASDLAAQADIVVDLQAGEERSIAATKTYTAQLAAIASLSAALAGDDALITALERIPAAVAETLKMDGEIGRVTPRYRYMDHCVVIGRGYNYATAFELALKLKEMTYVVAEPYSSADFLHGPMAMVEPGFPIFLVAPAGIMNAELQEFVEPLQHRQAEIIAISDERAILDQARVPLALPATVPEWLSPIAAIVPGQLFSMHLAQARDIDVDAPRGLTKVIETR